MVTIVSQQLTADDIKQEAKRLGADLVGVCSAQALNDNPPDAKWPQVPRRLWQDARSIVILAKRIPWGMFMTEGRPIQQSTPQQVMGRLENIALDVAYFLEERGFNAVALPMQQTDMDLKRGTYGPLSLRHAAVEAGLGTLGLNLMLLTPECGPRVYITAVLTNAEIEPDKRQEKQLCLGAACGRCLLVCPVDAIGHWSLDKRLCSTKAQIHGVSSLFSYLDGVLEAETPEERKDLLHSLELVELWQALRTGAGAVGACPRCLEVCPIGEDYALHLKEHHARIDAGAGREQKLAAMRQAERDKETIPGYEISKHWIGEDSA